VAELVVSNCRLATAQPSTPILPVIIRACPSVTLP
jgi:hypothetical protein